MVLFWIKSASSQLSWIKQSNELMGWNENEIASTM